MRPVQQDWQGQADVEQADFELADLVNADLAVVVWYLLTGSSLLRRCVGPAGALLLLLSLLSLF